MYKCHHNMTYPVNLRKSRKRKDQNKENGLKKAVLKILRDLAGKINIENKSKRERIEGNWRVPERYSKVKIMIYPSEQDN